MDIAVTTGLSGTFPLVSDQKRRVAYRTFRRVTTDPTLGIFDVGTEPACIDLGEMLNEQLDNPSMQGIENDIERVCGFDEEIDKTEATVSFAEARRLLLIRILITLKTGVVFTLIMNVDAVSAKVLNDADLG